MVVFGAAAHPSAGQARSLHEAIRKNQKTRRSGNWLQLYGVALLCGIGFTMSLFIGALAFPNNPHLVDEVKVGVLMGSILSAVLAVAVLLKVKRQ